MIITLRQFALAIHILLGIMWVGGIMSVGWGVFPATKHVPLATRRTFLQPLMKQTHLIFSAIGLGVITTDVLLGTMLGPLKTVEDVLTIPYGQKWLLALIVAFITLLWGVVFGYRKTMHVLDDDILGNVLLLEMKAH